MVSVTLYILYGRRDYGLLSIEDPGIYVYTIYFRWAIFWGVGEKKQEKQRKGESNDGGDGERKRGKKRLWRKWRDKKAKEKPFSMV